MTKILTYALFLSIALSVAGVWWFGKQEDAREGYIMPIQSWFSRIPQLDSNVAQAVYPFIFLPPDLYSRIVETPSKDPADLSILIHERVHIDRAREVSPFLYLSRYTSDPSFRLNEELLAIEAQMRYLRSFGVMYDIKEKALQFSDETYGRMLPLEEAESVLSALWEKTASP